MTASETLTVRDLGPAPERQVAKDLMRRGLMALPFAMAIGFIGWQWAGAASIAYAAVLIMANFWLSAALLDWSAKISLGLLMGVSLFGFVVRIALIALAVLAVRNQSWVAEFPMGLTLIVAHLGLLFWEARYVSASLAFPGLKPGSQE